MSCNTSDGCVAYPRATHAQTLMLSRVTSCNLYSQELGSQSLRPQQALGHPPGCPTKVCQSRQWKYVRRHPALQPSVPTSRSLSMPDHYMARALAIGTQGYVTHMQLCLPM